MAQIYLFTGEEQYLVYHEVKRRKDTFAEKFGVEGILEYKGERDAAEVVSALQGGGLFSTKKLVVIWGVPQDTIASNKVKMSQIDSVCSALAYSSGEGGSAGDADVLVVCVSYKPDKRKKEFKWFTKHADVKTFKPLKGVGLRKWTLGEIGSMMGDVSHDVVDHLLLLTGNDLWYVHHCVDMLSTWHAATGDAITIPVIDSLIYPRTEANNFAFLDAMFVNRDKALGRLDDARDAGTHWTLFLGAVYWGLKIMLQMVALYGEGKTTSSILAKEIGGPPFTFSRYLKFVPGLVGRYDDMIVFWDALVALDHDIKKGKVVDVSFWLKMKTLIVDFHAKG